MATDLAEFLGGGIGLSLLLHIPLLVGLGITGVATYAMLMLGNREFRPLELLIGGFVGLISLCYVVELAIAPPDWGEAARGAVVPVLPGGAGVALAVGMIGATVMPHVIYLHSALMAGRMPATNPAERRRLLRFSNREVLGALGLAGVVNMAMLAMAASAFHAGHPDVAEIETAYHTLGPLLGPAAASVFLLSLLASGFSSSVVGDAGRAVDHAGLRALAHSAVGAPRGDDAAGLRSGGAGAERDQFPGRQPDRAEPRPAGADAGAGLADRTARRDGRLRQRPRHPGGGDRLHRDRAGVERAAGAAAPPASRSPA